MFLVLSVSIGYSSLTTSLNITGLVTKVRQKADIRITDLKMSEVSNEGQSKYQEYNKENISVGVNLPNSNSSVTYKVEVTNIGNIEMGILSIEGLPENLELTDFQLKEKICDTSNVCKLGIKKDFYITIKYTSEGYNSSNTSYNLNLDFNFKAVYNVTYTDITVEDTYPNIILETDTLEVDLGENAPSSIKVLMSEAEITNYTYENGVLSIPNVSGDIEIIKNENPNVLATYLTNLYSPNSTVENNSITYKVDTTNGIIDDGLGGTVSSGGNLRYYGANPNNYIDIGDRDASGNIILWRIIGVFETKYATDSLPCNIDSNSDGHYDNCASEKLVKIIRDESIGDIPWDYTSSGSYDNNWSDATLNTLLNGAYYNSKATIYYKYEYDSPPIETTVDFTSLGLSSNVHEKVENALWNLGGISGSSSDTNYFFDLYSEGYYKWERGTTVYSGNPTEWVGKIGLMYPSDYGYATDLGSCSETLSSYGNSTCYTNDWLFDSLMYQWIMSPDSSASSIVFFVYSTGGVDNYNYYAFRPTGVRPVLYLKSDTVRLRGTGVYNDTIQNPYVVGLGDESTTEEIIYKITYTDITNDGYPSEITEGETLTVNFGENAPTDIAVKVSNVEITNYTYTGGVLTLANVSGNIEIINNDSSGTGEIPEGLIAFTIDGTTYYAEEGMTWAQWVESDYNNSGIYVIANEMIWNLNKSLPVVSGGSGNSSTSVIVENTAYYTVVPDW